MWGGRRGAVCSPIDSNSMFVVCFAARSDLGAARGAGRSPFILKNKRTQLLLRAWLRAAAWVRRGTMRSPNCFEGGMARFPDNMSSRAPTRPPVGGWRVSGASLYVHKDYKSRERKSATLKATNNFD